MESLLILAILIGALISSLFNEAPLPEAESSGSGSTYQQTQSVASTGYTNPSSVSRTKNDYAPSLPQNEQSSQIETYITKGPKEGEAIKDTNEVTFEFEGKIKNSPEERITFKTKLIDVDADWKTINGNKRTIVLPAGQKQYLFLVKAQTKNLIDPTPAQRSFELKISPYFEKIIISNLQVENAYRPSLITLTTRLQKQDNINITGWSIQGKNGSFTINQGAEKYRHGFQPDQDMIFADQNDRIYLVGTPSPLGSNFRLNECMGYLTHSYDFYPVISKSCPSPSKEDIKHLDICCREFINKIRRCEVPGYSTQITSLYVLREDRKCRSFINDHFNYAGCFRDYSRTDGFLKNIWYIYFGTKPILAKNDCDILYLKDQNGLTVDSYSYGREVCRYNEKL
ncbi:MAG: hypothetical protein GF370_02510 [Candidatus Nealsonbacteria bacterium]|nr:hypothetical protein [Candidatus Nealsonbacteria bacterium]